MNCDYQKKKWKKYILETEESLLILKKTDKQFLQLLQMLW